MDMLLLCAGAGDKTWTGANRDRPLRNKGKRQAQKIGAWMGRNRLRPDRVVAGADLRARVTAEKALKAAGWTAHGIERADALETGDVSGLLGNRLPLLVAHAAEIRELIDRLGLNHGPELSAGVLIGVACQSEQASLITRIDPHTLPDGFPFPAPDGPEERERPAYYYTQSAAIPFRRTAQGKEILIVRSSSGRHWVVPKGIVEPGLSPGDSARVEAEEEAGVRGEISEQPVGHYTYAKWGATCDVAVYTLSVTEEIAFENWEEKHRQRKWVPLAEAASMVNQPALRPILLGL